MSITGRSQKSSHVTCSPDVRGAKVLARSCSICIPIFGKPSSFNFLREIAWRSQSDFACFARAFAPPTKKRPSDGARTLTVSDEVGLRNEDGDRQKVRHIPSLPADNPRRLSGYCYPFVSRLRRFTGCCGIPWDGPKSFPLDRPRRLTCHVVNNPIDPLHFIDDPRRGAAQKTHVEGVKIGRHAVH